MSAGCDEVEVDTIVDDDECDCARAKQGYEPLLAYTLLEGRCTLLVGGQGAGDHVANKAKSLFFSMLSQTLMNEAHAASVIAKEASGFEGDVSSKDGAQH